jgi:hypothetical protein
MVLSSKKYDPGCLPRIRICFHPRSWIRITGYGYLITNNASATKIQERFSIIQPSGVLNRMYKVLEKQGF